MVGKQSARRAFSHDYLDPSAECWGLQSTSSNLLYSTHVFADHRRFQLTPVLLSVVAILKLSTEKEKHFKKSQSSSQVQDLISSEWLKPAYVWSAPHPKVSPHSPLSSPLLDSGGDPSSSSGLAKKSKPFRASSVSGSSLKSEVVEDGVDDCFFLTICQRAQRQEVTVWSADRQIKPKAKTFVEGQGCVRVLLQPGPRWSCPVLRCPPLRPRRWTLPQRSRWT